MRVQDSAEYNLKSEALKVAKKWRQTGQYKRVTIQKVKTIKEWRNRYGSKYPYLYVVKGWK